MRGRDAEQAAADWVVARGFRVLWRNLRIGALELDLVAKKDDLVIIVEVRTRGPGAFASALASISVSKQRTLLRASQALWRTRLSKMADVARVRIDVAAVTLGREGAEIEWIAGAITE
ncbi:MAG: YraN family protein [Polyangiaceae bacterium]|nr:YraN family protein [Polyangiaceae bacterium]